MRRMVIISPDPESARMLALAFDLHGWEVGLAADLQQLSHLPHGDEADLTLIDLIDSAATRQLVVGRKAVAGQLIVIAPHGMSSEEAKHRYGFADRIVRRPYELLNLVHLADEPVPRPSTPPRTIPKWKQPSRPAAKKTAKNGRRGSAPRKKTAKTARPQKRSTKTSKRPLRKKR